jgi:hypothetical protein
VFFTIKSFVETRKSSRKELWFKIFKETLEELRSENGVIYKTCLLDIEKLFSHSVSIESTFKNEDQLKKYLELFVAPWISKFEMDSNGYKKYEGLYPNDGYSYSERTYFEILLHIGQPSEFFRNAFIDSFEKLYRNIIKESEFGSSRKIDSKKFTELVDNEYKIILI